jgi:hypothetical protein
MVLIEVYLATGANVSSLLIPSFWEKPRVKNLALYFSILPLAACFILKSHFDHTTSLLFGLGTISHTSFFIMDWYSSVMSSAHSFFWMDSSKHVGSSSSIFHIKAM